METLFFDGSCGLCHATVRFVIARDRAARFVYAPIGGETFMATFTTDERARLPDSVIVRTEDARTLVRSAAIVHLLGAIGGGWRVVGSLLWIVPRPLRDVGYRAVASVRRRLVAAPRDACPVVPSERRARFLA